MGQTVKEKLFETVKIDDLQLANGIYYAVQEGMVKLEDLASSIPYDQLDCEAISNLPLEVEAYKEKIKVWPIIIDEEKLAFYFAEYKTDALSLHREIYGNHGLTIIEMNLDLKSFTSNAITKEIITFFDLLKDVHKFPHCIGEFHIPKQIRKRIVY